MSYITVLASILPWLREKMMPAGGVMATVFTDTTFETVSSYGGERDPAIWTGAYLAAEAFRCTTPLRQDSCVCRSNAALVGKELTGQHEKLPKRWRNRPAGVCLQGPAPNHPRAALAEDRGRECRPYRDRCLQPGFIKTKTGSLWVITINPG